MAPYRAATGSGAANEAGMAWRCSLFDKTGNLHEVEISTGADLSAPLGSNTNRSGKIQTDDDAELVLVSDQAGMNRKSDIDALGRLVKVWEDPTGANYETTYTYNALDNLIQTSQLSVPTGRSGSITQTCTFNYDSLKRSTSATNPESGTVSYRYDAENRMVKAISANNQSQRYAYDAGGRLTRRVLNNGMEIWGQVRRPR